MRQIFSVVQKHVAAGDWRKESEDGSVEFETPTDDEEITIPSQDRYREVPDIPDSDICDEQTLSNTQREDWLLPTEPMHGARPRQTGREHPPVIDNPALRDAAGNTAVRNPSRTFLVSPGRRILIEEEVFTSPKGAVRPLSLRVYHMRYEPYLNLSGWFSGGQFAKWRSVSEEHWVAGGYAGRHGIAHAEELGHTTGGKSRTKNTSHLTGDTGSPAGGAHESAAVRRNY